MMFHPFEIVSIFISAQWSSSLAPNDLLALEVELDIFHISTLDLPNILDHFLLPVSLFFPRFFGVGGVFDRRTYSMQLSYILSDVSGYLLLVT